MQRTMLLSLLIGGSLTGCALVSEILEGLANLELLGVMPAEGFSDPTSPDYGKVRLALGGRDDLGFPLPPKGTDIEVVPDDGTEVEEGDWDENSGHDEGSFVLLVDGSGSVEVASRGDCEGCPTDPGRLRVEATKQLATELSSCGGWRMSLMEFGSSTVTPGFEVTHTLADFDPDPVPVIEAADRLASYEGTPLWDATLEVLDSLADDAAGAFETVDEGKFGDGAGRGIVVLSDGADTLSASTLDDVIARALELGIAVHTVGFGPASDSFDIFDAAAVDGLRELATETGGYYGYVDSVHDLPDLATAIAGAQCGGYTELEATFLEPAASGERVTGKVRLKGSSIGVPFTFRAP